MEISEEYLWYCLDKIAVRESGVGMDMEKADAAENMMRHLKKPDHERCKYWHRKAGGLLGWTNLYHGKITTQSWGRITK